MACFVAWLFAQWYKGAMIARDKVQESKDELYKEIIKQMNARLDVADARLTATESRLHDCERDRSDLRQRLDGLAN